MSSSPAPFAGYEEPEVSEATIKKSFLLRLPNELLDFIFAMLDSQPPSNANFIELPVSSWTVSEVCDLKRLSLASHRLRRAVLPRLFRHARLNPASLTEFLDFVHRTDMTSKIETIVADLHEPYYDVHPAWWCRLLNEIPVSRITIGGSPERLAETAKVSIDLSDSWAFNQPYQYLELQQHPHIAQQQISYDDLPGVLGAKQWHSVKMNEGSSLAAYTTFEYFLKKPPSLVSNVQTCLSGVPTGATAEISQKVFGRPADDAMAILKMLEALSEFHFVAIFPFYNHVDNILKCIRRMRNLRKLFIKLCPQPDSSVLDDEIQAAQRHFDINDPWNEITTAYLLVAHTIRFLGIEAKLETFTIDDVKIEGIKDSIIDYVTDVLQNSWIHDGRGTWSKVSETLASDGLLDGDPGLGSGILNP